MSDTISRVKERLTSLKRLGRPMYNDWNVGYIMGLAEFEVLAESEKDELILWLMDNN